MTKNQTFGLLMLGALGTTVSCEGGPSRPSASLGASDDCPYGTFRPVGIDECVFPANDVNNQLIGVSDNRCAVGQPAIPPSCVSDSGGRSYLSTSSNCAPGYRFSDGACDRGVGGVAGSSGFPVTGGAGSFGGGEGAAGLGAFGGFGGADTAGAGGSCIFGVDPSTGQCLPSDAGSDGTSAIPVDGDADGTD